MYCGIIVKKNAHTMVQHRTQVCLDVANEATKQGVDPVLATAVAWRESAFLRKARSSAGAVGPMQVMPRFWCKSKKCDYIEAGVRALKYYTERYGEQPGLCAYFSGKTCSKSGVSASRYRSSVIMTAGSFHDLMELSCSETGC